MNRNIRIIFTSLITLVCCSCASNKVAKVDALTFKPSKDFVKDARDMSDQEENIIGRAVSAKIFSQYKAVSNPELTRYLNEVGKTLAIASDRPETFAGYSFVVLETDEVNAMSAPGGYIFITRGFLRLLADEDALAGGIL